MTKKNQAEKIKKLPEACEGCEHSIRPEEQQQDLPGLEG